MDAIPSETMAGDVRMAVLHKTYPIECCLSRDLTSKLSLERAMVLYFEDDPSIQI